MYSKYNKYRFLSFVIMVAGVFWAYQFKKSRILKSIKGSILEVELKEFICKNPKIHHILNVRNE